MIHPRCENVVDDLIEVNAVSAGDVTGLCEVGAAKVRHLWPRASYSVVFASCGTHVH